MNKKFSMILGTTVASSLLFTIIPNTNEVQAATTNTTQINTQNQKTKSINIKKYQFNITRENGTNPLIIPNAVKTIYYKDSNGKRVNVKTFKSNKYGQISGKITVPKNIKRVYVEHILKTSNNEMLLNKDRKVVKLYSHINLSQDNIVNKVDKGTMGNPVSKRNLNWTYVKVWQEYFNFIQDQKTAVNYAVDQLNKKGYKNIDKYSSKPSKIVFENSSKEAGLSIYSVSKTQNDLKKGDHYQLIKLPIIQNSTNYNSFSDRVKVFVAHEYSHWQMVQAVGVNNIRATEGYKTHSSYNKNEIVSWKEGYALLNANRYPWKFNMNGNLDIKVQTSQRDNPKYGAREKLYGKSTNYTVFNVLRDIYDPINRIEGSNDRYNIAEDVLGKGKYNQDQLEKLSNGLMYITMRDSKAKNLSEYIQYVDKHYVKDHKEFYKILKLNGLTKDGKFTLDENNKRIN